MGASAEVCRKKVGNNGQAASNRCSLHHIHMTNRDFYKKAFDHRSLYMTPPRETFSFSASRKRSSTISGSMTRKHTLSTQGVLR